MSEWEPGTEIPRGLPRPIYKGRPLPWSEVSERLTPFGDPIDSERALSDPRLDDCYWDTLLQNAERLGEAWEDGLCVLCGESLGDPVFFFTDHVQLVQGALHDRCARLTRAHCPGIPSGGWVMYRAPRSAWEELTRSIPDFPEGQSWLAPLPDECEIDGRKPSRPRPPSGPPPGADG